MSSFNLQIVTVSEELFNGTAQELHCTGVEGEMTILAQHEPFITTLKTGALRVTDEDKEKHTFEITNGVLEVAHNRAVVLCSRSNG